MCCLNEICIMRSLGGKAMRMMQSLFVWLRMCGFRMAFCSDRSVRYGIMRNMKKRAATEFLNQREADVVVAGIKFQFTMRGAA